MELTTGDWPEITPGMKRAIISIGAAAILVCAQSLFAGPERMEAKDYKAAPAPVVEPCCNWTGFYVGIHLGYSWGDASYIELDESDPPFQFNDLEGLFGGGQMGFNYQIGSMFVIGVEGEFVGSDIDDSTPLSDDSESTVGRMKNDWTGTAAGRIGLSFWCNRILAYAKGGAAFAHFDYHNTNDEPETWDADHVRVAPMVGAGVEYAFNCHWSVKVEYQHLFFDDEDITGSENDAGTIEPRTFHVDAEQDSIQAGVNFRF